MTRVLSGAADDATRGGDIAEPQSNRAGRSLHSKSNNNRHPVEPNTDTHGDTTSWL